MAKGSVEADHYNPALVEARVGPREGSFESLRSSLGNHGIAAACLLAVLLIAIYFKIGAKLVTDWYEIADYSHGFLVPFFAAFILWDKRKTLSR